MDHRHASAHRIDLVVYPGFKALEAIGPMSVFDYANVHLRARGQSDGYEVRVVSQRHGAVRSDTLMALEATHTLAELEARGTGCTVVVVGSRHIEQVLGGSGELVAWLERVAPRVQRLISLCSGSFFLAEAGLLDGRRAATHWSVTAQLAQRHPRVQVDADAIYLREEIRDAQGSPGGQSQFSVPLAAQAAQHGGVQAVQQWVMAHLAEPLTLTQMAEQAHMSERHLRRVFQQETGQSPTAFVESVRLEAAKQLLESQAHLPLKTVAARVGLGSEQALRHLFVRHLGITPVAYRDRFGGRAGAG
jgi:transcriptional regulator GlxA family with amidase domain